MVHDPKLKKLRDFRKHGYDRYDPRDPQGQHKALPRHREITIQRRAGDRFGLEILDALDGGAIPAITFRTRGPKRARRNPMTLEQRETRFRRSFFSFPALWGDYRGE